MRSLLRAAFLIGVLVLGAAPPAAALETRVTELRVAGGGIRASLEIRDMFPEFRRCSKTARRSTNLDWLWKTRPVWTSSRSGRHLGVRIVLDPATRVVTVADQYGEVSRQPAWQEPLTLRPDLGRADALSDGARYYVRVLATLGTIAEKETAQATRAVFGDDESAVSLAAMGKMLFHAVLQVNDYLQSVSSDARTRDVTGRDLKPGVKLQ